MDVTDVVDVALSCRCNGVDARDDAVDDVCDASDIRLASRVSSVVDVCDVCDVCDMADVSCGGARFTSSPPSSSLSTCGVSCL